MTTSGGHIQPHPTTVTMHHQTAPQHSTEIWSGPPFLYAQPLNKIYVRETHGSVLQHVWILGGRHDSHGHSETVEG